jgi:anaphase-promoting complex subunit 1
MLSPSPPSASSRAAAATAAASRSGSGTLNLDGIATAGQAVDWGAVGLAHVHGLAGACFAIGLRFAGTCNAGAEALLRHHLLQLLHAKRRAPGGPNEQSVAPAAAAAAAAAAQSSGGVGIAVAPAAAGVGKLDKAVIENCISVVLLALALVMAGSGHLPTFRLIQVGVGHGSRCCFHPGSRRCRGFTAG